MSLFKFKAGQPYEAQAIQPAVLASQFKEGVLRDLLARDNRLSALDDEHALMVLATEYSNWTDAKRRIDILALDDTGQLVVVELKRDSDGAHAELQALRYAAMISALTFDDAVDALAKERRKTMPSAEVDTARSDLLKFLNLNSPSEVTFGKVPRVMLIAEGFNKEITTTVLWLMEHMSIDISCYQACLFPLGADEFALQFDLLLPLPEQKDYMVQVRKKNLEVAEKQAIQRSPTTWKILQTAGKLLPDTPLRLLRNPRPNLEIPDSQRHAVYVGNGQVRWTHDQKTYSMSGLTVMLCEIHGAPLPSATVQGPAYWGREGSDLTLTEEAGQLAAGSVNAEPPQDS